MRFIELYDKLRNNEPVFVEFINVVAFGCDEGPDNGMIARLCGICKTPDEPNELHLFFDFTGFEEHNKAIASHDWYDASGKPTLTWFETTFYPSNGKWDTYFTGTMESEIGEAFALHNNCPCCYGGEAIYWEDSCNNALIDSSGEMKVTVNSKTITFHVERCPKCGQVFENTLLKERICK